MILRPDWQAPATVHAYSTTRNGGISQVPFDSLNLAAHVGDQLNAVQHNRQLLQNQLHCPETPRWLQQVHGTTVLAASDWQPNNNNQADAIWTDQEQTICSILTADCLPVLFCDKNASCVAAAHAGWRGLAAGVLEATLHSLPVPAHEVMVWLGPAIGAQAFEVGAEVREAFMATDSDSQQAFRATDKPQHWLADLPLLARLRLAACGVTDISGGNFCTYREPQRFFSYRRDGKTGRMASLIWLA